MTPWIKQNSFLSAFELTSKISSGNTPVVSIIGAGGKTSLMFKLAEEAKNLDATVLVTTTTKMWIPKRHQYDFIDLSGNAFTSHTKKLSSGIYVAGINATEKNKMRGVAEEKFRESLGKFNLILIEADGSATKPLKGWKSNEPVIVPETNYTIGVVDVTTIGQPITSKLIHRLNIFTELTKSSVGETLSAGHLQHLITAKNGLLWKSRGKSFVYLSKMESSQLLKNASSLRSLIPDINVVTGSVHHGEIYA